MTKEDRLILIMKVQNELYKLHKCYKPGTDGIELVGEAMGLLNTLYGREETDHKSIILKLRGASAREKI